ncbi:MAG: carbohydrate binding family 9 domain-containing protein, partial [Planctomycetota bacterium]
MLSAPPTDWLGRLLRAVRLPLLLASSPGLSAVAQEAAAPEAEMEPVPQLTIRRRPDDVPRPIIDGRIDDALWSTIAPETGFRQVVPVEAGTPSERTELRVGYDGEALYVAVSCFDRDPSGIRGTQMRRDANLDPDDRVEILLDPFFNQRDAFWFQIGPSGGKGDALIGRNGSRFEKSWDGLFEAKSTWTDEGWFAEFAIPFATTGFDPETDRFGFNVRRFIRRKEEEVQWSRPFNRIFFFSVAEGAHVEAEGRRQAA